MPADWTIRSWPACTRHVFMSHCQEDRDRLVLPLGDRLEQSGCSIWIDKHNYPLGRANAFEVLRDKLLECRHVVFFVTANFLKQGRGWTGVERGYSTLLQENLMYGPREVCHVQLPLFFVPRNHKALARSAWGAVVGTGGGEFYPGGCCDAGAIEWARRTILRFVWQEQQFSLEVFDRMQRDSRMRRSLSSDPNLENRILGISPAPVPAS